MRLLRIFGVLACLSACIIGPPDPPPMMNLVGEVFDANSGVAIVDATAQISAVTSSTVTNAQGTYSFVLRPSGAVVLTVTAPGYAPHRQVVQEPYGTVLTQLRPIELSPSATLPSAGAAPLEIALVHADATTTLRIEAGDLLTATGAAATGTIQVQFTFWHPLEPLTSIPGRQEAEVPGGVVRVKTWGMASIALLQAGLPLQVAPGQALEWTTRLPNALTTLYAALPARLQPQLQNLNPQSGRWRSEGTLTFDTATQTLVGSLPHLGEWGMNATPGNDGGCVQGRLLNKCGSTVASGYFAVWFLDTFEVRDFRGNADSSGNYCVNTGRPDAWGATTYAASLTDPNQATQVRVSGTDINDSSACNPLPYICQTCNEEDFSCNDCGYGLHYSSTHPGLFGDVVPTSCNPNTTPITLCHRCPGTCGDANDSVFCNAAQGGPGCIEGCDVLPDVVIADPACDSPPTAAASPNSTQPPAPVNTCGGGLGDLCGADSAACCAGGLTCSDYRCVPMND